MQIKKTIALVFLCFSIIMVKYVISGAYFDYKLRSRYLQSLQDQYIDENKRSIASLEQYRSANYLFTYKEQLNMNELTPEKTIILHDNTSKKERASTIELSEVHRE